MIIMQCNEVAYDKHSCAMHWDCIAYAKRSLKCIGIKLLMIGIVVQCNGIKLLMKA